MARRTGENKQPDVAGTTQGKGAGDIIARGVRARWWKRRGSKRSGFWYEDARGRRITNEENLARIKELVLPPAWTNVRISPSARSRLQAIGIDTSGRVQYHYHATYAASQQRKKYSKIERFGEFLPALRRREVNEYIKTHTSEEFSAKDFRTWGGTLLAATELAELGAPADEKQANSNMAQAVKRVAERLGNTPIVCRSCYIHPTVEKLYLEGVTLDEFRRRNQKQIRRLQPEYEPEESALLKMFHSAEKIDK